MMIEQINKTLQELDGQIWGEPPFPSHLVRTCYTLRHKPLRDFTVEDLRIMIGQHLSLNYLLPLAIEYLEQDPLAAGDFYPGDLLVAVLRVPPDFWQSQPQMRSSVQTIIDCLDPFPAELYSSLLIFQASH